ncbi:MAG: sporulation protein YunB [Firmicutes bacterium]|nr:sporulation protein YunB [Bacillota bacterium]
MRRWGRTRHGPLAWKVLFILFLALLFLAFLVFEGNIKPALAAIAQARVKIIAIEAITEAIEEEIIQTVQYQDLIHIHKDCQNRPVLLQPNTIAISRVAARTTEHVKKSLQSLEDEVIFLPMGQVLGSDLLANMGPRLRITVMPIGTVTVNLLNDLEEAGINQTLHKIVLEINANLGIAIPLIVAETHVQHQVLLTQAVIVGEVPDTFFQLKMP